MHVKLLAEDSGNLLLPVWKKSLPQSLLLKWPFPGSLSPEVGTVGGPEILSHSPDRNVTVFLLPLRGSPCPTLNESSSPLPTSSSSPHARVTTMPKYLSRNSFLKHSTGAWGKDDHPLKCLHFTESKIKAPRRVPEPSDLLLPLPQPPSPIPTRAGITSL